MVTTREIATQDWGKFLPHFSQRNLARPVRLETGIAPGEGEPVLAQHRPLLAVDLDPKGSEAPAIMVTLGGLDVSSPEFTHVINGPTRLWLAEESGGLPMGMEIESSDEGRTFIVFEREQALPPESSVGQRRSA